MFDHDRGVSPEPLTPGSMDPADPVNATEPTGVTEATDSALEGIASDGPREILVHETELEVARAVLADAQR